jgi:hypothetical protein
LESAKRSGSLKAPTARPLLLSASFIRSSSCRQAFSRGQKRKSGQSSSTSCIISGAGTRSCWLSPTRSLLWFIPAVWAAYARLYLEQEKARDEEVLESGVNPHSYATCVVDTAQFSREPALPAGLSFSGRRKRVLKDRIMSILKRGKHMKHGLLLFCLAVLILGAIAVLSASGLDAPNAGEKKYGSLLLSDYRPKTPDEVGILATLTQCEAAFTSHDLQKFNSLFARDAVYHPCGVSAKYPIESKYCQDLIKYNFGFLKFEKYYDPRITVHGSRAVVKILIETGDYLGDYTFVLTEQSRGWMVSETDYANVRWKG